MSQRLLSSEFADIDRLVALKVIRPDFVLPELIWRFARESEVLGRLQHPGIAQIYEAGTSEGPYGPQSFFAMELVRGQTLTDYAQSHSLPLNERLELFARICEAVHYAHQQGVVHRDLKPANIMVDATGQPKIVGQLPDRGETRAGCNHAGAHEGGDLLAQLLVGRHRRPTVDFEDHRESVAIGSERRTRQARWP